MQEQPTDLDRQRGDGASAIQRASRGEVSFLSEYIWSGKINVSKKFHEHKGFFRFISKVSTDRQFIEALNHLRDTIIRFAIKKQKEHEGIIVALSGVRGDDGSSLLSFLLTLALGECTQRRVAFLDGRFNSQHFEAIADYLRLTEDTVDLKKSGAKILTYHKVTQPNVYFLRNSSNESGIRFFSDRNVRGFLEDLKEAFDFTVINMPPLVRGSTSVFIAPAVNQLYLIARAGKTKKVEIQRCMEIAEQAGVQITGVVLNQQKVPLILRWLFRDYFFMPRFTVRKAPEVPGESEGFLPLERPGYGLERIP